MSLLTISDSLAPSDRSDYTDWAIVSLVEVGTTTAVVHFNIKGHPAGALSATNLKCARVGTLNPGDKILVLRTGSGAWVILDRYLEVEDN